MIVLEYTEYINPELPWYTHVRVWCFDPCTTLDDFTAELERRWPGTKRWRHQPTVYMIRDFDKNSEGSYMFARFSVLQ